MTFEEKLDRARTGSRAAYESLCLGSLDKLYAAAVIALKNEKIARSAVISAINDGYAGISRIRDEKHLRSWLVHELTKNAVDKLKELKAEGVSHTATGDFAETGKLPDVERLVFAVHCVFGYGAREISVLTGMSEETVNDKVNSAKNRLGAAYTTVCSAAESFAAPASLRERYMGFDESVARLELAEAERALIGKQKKEAPEKAETDAREVQPTPELHPGPELQPVPEAPAEPDMPSEEPEKVPEEPDVSETADAAETAPESTEDEESVFTEEDEVSAENDLYDEDDEEDRDDMPEDVSEEPETRMPGDGSENGGTKLNAETFIAVVSAEKMKGSEFLRLIGNTRISNSAYREIEQNPRLTKKRLITLLEESPLTETDYYKLLTAVKNRRRVLDAKEENRLALERAGLYDGSRRERYRRKRREKPKTELELAIGIDRDQRPSRSPASDENSAAEDDYDYRLSDSSGSFAQQKILSERRKNEQRRKNMDLGTLVNSTPDHGTAVDPMSHAALHSISDESSSEPVDPFAAIGANDAGTPSKPDSSDTQRSERRADDEPESVNEEPEAAEPAFGTAEFTVAPQSTEISDTRQFEVLSPDTPWRSENEENADAPALEDETADKTDDPVTSGDNDSAAQEPETDPEPEEAPVDPFTVHENEDTDAGITTVPIQDGISVTQIITGYTADEDVSDETAEVSAEIPEADENADDGDIPEEPAAIEAPDDDDAAFSPDLGLVFDDASDSMSGSDDPDDLSFSFDEKDDGDSDDDGAPMPAPKAAAQGRTAPEPSAPVIGGEEESYGGDDEEDRGRKRYKGNEYFIDDNEYYEGVNRGKIVTCAILAVLLAAGSAGMRFLNRPEENAGTVINDTAITEESTAAETVPGEDIPEKQRLSDDVTLAKLSSYDDMTADRYTPAEEVYAASGYLRASADPFPADIVTGCDTPAVLFAEDTAYILTVRDDCTIRSVRFGESSAEDTAPEETDTDTDVSAAEETPAEEPPSELHTAAGLLYAYTAIDGDLYIVSGKADSSGNALYETQITVYASDLSKKSEYALSGTFAGAGIVDGKLSVAVCGSPDKLAAAYNNGLAAAKRPYYTENGELHEISADEIYAIDGAVHNGICMICTTGSKPLTILGGNSVFPDFGEYDVTLAIPDGDVTYGIDVAKDLKVVSSKAYSGSAFSPDCIGHGGMIGMSDGGICAYKNGKTLTVPEETAAAAAWSDKGTAYVVTEHNGGQKMLYGFDMSGDAPENAAITASDIYTDKLIKAGDHLVGLKAEPAPDGERAGLRLSMYEYGDELRETAYSIIELDKDTPRENLKYLSSPAETLPTFIGTNEDGTLFAVPTVYFDGYSEVERVVLLQWDGTLFSVCGEYITYDEKSSVICTTIRGGRLYVITDTKVAVVETESMQDENAE
ncbi:MAG: hypothetical protein J6O50_02250 [Ruminiclostridium sp.]|nr:hypothetical protein [Ruminiclostridium sp.]